MKYSIIFFFLIFITNNSFANRGFYLDASIGPSFQSEEEPEFDLFDPELKYKGETGKALAIGYGLDVFHLEFIYADLGDTGFIYEGLLDYSRKTTFIGLNLRWKWRWFSFSGGVGTVSTDASTEEKIDNTQTITYDLDEGSSSYSAYRFSVGVNFPISERFNLYIENVVVGWTQDDNELVWTDSDDLFNNGGDESLKSNQTVNQIGFGLRFYFF